MSQKGTSHHIMHLGSSGILVLVTMLLIVPMINGAGLDHQSFIAWMTTPYNATLLVILLATAAFHFKLVMEVVIDDYIYSPGMLAFCHRLNTAFMLVSAAIGIWAILALTLIV